MLQYAADINKAVKGLGAIAENRSPSIQLLIDNWPIAVLTGLALSGRMLQRHKKNELTSYNILMDTGAILAPVVSLLTLQRLGLERQERKQRQERQEQQAQIHQQTAIRPLQVTAPPKAPLQQVAS